MARWVARHPVEDTKLNWTLAVICSDCGRDLAQSPNGPWLDGRPSNAGIHIQTFPVPEHRMWASSYNLMANSDRHNTRTKLPLGAIPQSLARLPKCFETSRDINPLHKDPIYALNHVLSFFVYSEAISLSFIASQINRYFALSNRTPEVTEAEALSNLLHCQ
jgi:hypothetical protein